MKFVVACWSPGGKLHGSSLAVGASRKSGSARSRSRPRAVRRHSVLPLLGYEYPHLRTANTPIFWLRLVILMGLVLPLRRIMHFCAFDRLIALDAKTGAL